MWGKVGAVEEGVREVYRVRGGVGEHTYTRAHTRTRTVKLKIKRPSPVCRLFRAWECEGKQRSVCAVFKISLVYIGSCRPAKGAW